MDSYENKDLAFRWPRGKWLLAGLIAVIGYFLWTEHKAHVIEYFPFLMLLACVFMHRFHRAGSHLHKAGEKLDPAKLRHHSEGER